MKYAIVTGGTRGIGKEICRKLLMQGFSVISVYDNDDVSAQLTRQEFETEFRSLFYLIKCDLSNTDNILFLLSEVKLITESVDVLILNAGKTIRKGLVDMTIEEWESVMAVNITTPLFLIQRFLPLMLRGSNIIFTGSSMAVFPHSVSLSYGISKSAVHAMVKNLVKFLVPFEIRINCVAPGFVDTEWQKDKSPEVRESIMKKISLKHFAKPEEVASVYLFIIDNQYLNGEIITIDGGYSYQ
ncbi:MAG: SDR family oxidoreductase [Bacteroidales bacterium]|jgi:3-oxoacyl-[acyl-carrier protein] reductase|nr:SDR family oxidoreductase [Bacteroidales bacterium]